MRKSLLTKGIKTLTKRKIMSFAGQLRADAKLLAKILIRQFVSFASVLRASVQQVYDQRSLGDVSISSLKIVKATADFHLAHSNIHNCPVPTDWGATKHDYINQLACKPIEYRIILCLDNRIATLPRKHFQKALLTRPQSVYLR